MSDQNVNKYVKGNVSDFSETKGYFIGRFMGERGFPNLESDEVEIAWKTLPTVFDEKTAHFHKGGVEINIVVAGKYKVLVGGNGVELSKGDFLVVYPQTPLRNLSAEPGTELIVVKAPSLPDDKFDSKK